MVVFRTTAMLSLSIKELGSRVDPNMLMKYFNEIIYSTASILEAANSDPKVDNSIVFCLLEVHVIGVLSRRTNIPVTDLLVNLSLA